MKVAKVAFLLFKGSDEKEVRKDGRRAREEKTSKKRKQYSKSPLFPLSQGNAMIYDVAAFSDGAGLAILCPLCSQVHHHGLGAGNRVPHCYYETENEHDSYDLVPVDGSIPQEAFVIGKTARRAFEVLKYRHNPFVSLRSTPKKSDGYYWTIIRATVQRARQFNSRWIAEQMVGCSQATASPPEAAS